jgi:site-specific recombinase XerD
MLAGTDNEPRPVVERLMNTSTTEWLFGDRRSMYRQFRQHLEDLGMSTKAVPHVIRHSRASHLLGNGVPIFDVAKLIGDTLATVERV